MEETWEYRDNEKVIYKARFKLNLPEKTLEDVECLVTQEHIFFEAEEQIKIPVRLIQNIEVPMHSFEQSQEVHTSTTILTYLDNGNNKRNMSLMGALRSLHSFKKEIDVIKEMSWLLEGLKKVGWLVEAVEDRKVILNGQNINEIGYSPKYSRGSSKRINSIFYVVRTEILQKSGNPYYDDAEGVKVAEIYNDATGVKWVGGELADRLNEDFEIVRLLEKIGETEIQIRAHIESGTITISHQTAAEITTEYPFELFDRIAKHSREIKIEAVTISDMGSRELSETGRRDYMKDIIIGFLGGFLIAAGLTFWIIRDVSSVVGKLIVSVGVGLLLGTVIAVATALINADKTPLGRYQFVRAICSAVRKILEKGPPPT